MATKIDPKRLNAALRLANAVRDPDSTRYALGSIRWLADASSLWIEATDGRRLVRTYVDACEHSCDIITAWPEKLRMPLASAKVCLTIGDAGIVTKPRVIVLSVSERRKRETVDREIVLAQSEGRYPKTDDVFPTTPAAATLSGSIAQLNAVFPEHRGTALVQRPHRLDPDNKPDIVYGTGIRSASGALDVVTGSVPTVCFDQLLVRDWSRFFDDDDTVKVSIYADGPAQFVCGNSTYLLMPLSTPTIKESPKPWRT